MGHHVEIGALASELPRVTRGTRFAALNGALVRGSWQRGVHKVLFHEPKDEALRGLAIQETERRRIAAELHDGLGQVLTLLMLELCNAKESLASSIGGSVTAVMIERASAEARNAMAELRRSVMALYPAILDDLGLVASLSCLIRDVRQAEPGLRVESLVSVGDLDVPRALHIVIFRIVQEGVTNVVKHAGASSLRVSLRKTEAILLLTIEDDGCGIASPNDPTPRNRSGLAGMTRRAQVSYGELTISSGRESGTCLTASWPLAGGIHVTGRAPGS